MLAPPLAVGDLARREIAAVVPVAARGRACRYHSGQPPIPEEVYRALARVVEALREGKVITVLPQTQRLSTQETADFLGVSRAALVKLLSDRKALSRRRYPAP